MTNTDPRYSRLSLNEDEGNGHVLFNTFGLAQAQQKGLLDQVLHETPAVRPVAAAQLSLMAYQTDYGIYNHHHPDPERPLAIHAMHPRENAYEGGPILSLVRRFHNYRLADMGYRLEEFWQLEYPIAMFIFELAEHAITQKNTVAGKAEAELAKEMGKL